MEVGRDTTEWNEVQQAMNNKIWEEKNNNYYWDDEWRDVKFKLLKLERVQNKHFFIRYYKLNNWGWWLS